MTRKDILELLTSGKRMTKVIKPHETEYRIGGYKMTALKFHKTYNKYIDRFTEEILHTENYTIINYTYGDI
jgi:hypothetical protein